MGRDMTDPAGRIRWAVRNSGKTLQSIADTIGCSHATLSQWQTGVTTIEHVKVGLLVRFAAETGVNLQWLLSGDGQAITTYSPTENHDLLTQARYIVQEVPNMADAAASVLAAISNTKR